MKRLLFTICVMLLLATPAFAAEEGVRVAVIDSGISTAAIAPQHLTEGYNYVSPQEGTGDRIGHGTAIASLIVGSDTAEIPGICPEAVLVPLVFYTKDAAGEEVSGSAEQVAQAIYDAVDRYRCRIINLSFCSLIPHDTLRAAVDYAEKQGVLIIASAGNWQETLPGAVCYPGGYDSVICVGAAREDGTIADFSLRNGAVDLLAQGTDLTAATRQGSQRTAEGTSYAAALVTGAAARLWSNDPQLTAGEVRTKLLAATRRVEGLRVLEPEAVLAGAQIPAFTDVNADSFCYDAVRWAVAIGVTNGTTNTTFSPNATCTRAQIITFLWRAAGSPEPGYSGSYYNDVSSGAYYAKAANWAAETGIISLNGAHFAPDTLCTRAAAVEYIWHYAKSPKAADVSFSDVQPGTKTAEAVSWAVGHGVTNGKTAATFAPDETCTRGQIVTFLHRYFVEPLEVTLSAPAG